MVNESKMMAVILDGVVQLEYDRAKALPPHQLEFLNKMDEELKTQVVIGEQSIQNPDIYQRAQFVAINLFTALRDANESVAAAMCAYLANRVPDLKQVKAQSHGGQLTIDLVFDEEYVRQVNVDFSPKKVSPPNIH